MLEEKSKNFINKLKVAVATNKGKDSKRKIESLAVFIIILIITVILINMIWNEGKSDENEGITDTTKTLAKQNISENDNARQLQLTSTSLEEKLENILQNIEGVGKVKVLLTYSESSKTLAMYNEDSTKNDTEETDTSGGNRKITQSSNKKEVIYQEINGKKVPVTQSIIEPKIEGAIITAAGAKNSRTKENIIQAVEAATGLATHKIQVFEMAN